MTKRVTGIPAPKAGDKVWYWSNASWGSGRSVKSFAIVREVNGRWATLTVWNGKKNCAEAAFSVPLHSLEPRKQHFKWLDDE